MAEPAAALDQILVTARLQQAMSVAAAMAIPDAMARGPRSVEELSTEIGADASALYRLLGTLAAGGLLVEEPDRRFRLTEVGELLRSDVRGSRREWAILNGKPYVREAWSHLEHAIRTGENAFRAIHGESIWTWRAARPEEQAAFDRTMASNSGPVARAVAEAFDFGPLGTIVDVGGGTGTLVAALLRRHPGLRGIVFDQPDVVDSDATRALLEAEGVADRVELVGGDFFASVPRGAGGYIVKSILHDWDDDDCVRILRSIRDATEDDAARLFVVELVMGPPNEDLPTRIFDLHMLVMPGGRERSEPEWRLLFERAGFALEEVRPTSTPYRLLVGRPNRSAALPGSNVSQRAIGRTP